MNTRGTLRASNIAKICVRECRSPRLPVLHQPHAPKRSGACTPAMSAHMVRSPSVCGLPGRFEQLHGPSEMRGRGPCTEGDALLKVGERAALELATLLRLICLILRVGLHQDLVGRRQLLPRHLLEELHCGGRRTGLLAPLSGTHKISNSARARAGRA